MEFLPKNAYLGPPTFVLANSKCVAPATMLFKATLQVSDSDSKKWWLHGVSPNHISNLPFGRFSVFFLLSANKCLTRPADIRFGQFEVYGTCDYVVRSHVTSFGVGFHELLVAWRMPHPYIDRGLWS